MKTSANLRRHNAFTLVEVLVALGIMAILLVIIVVPLRLGFDTFHIGKARADTQSALQTTMTGFETDLRDAIYVFPNGIVPGVSDKQPYAIVVDNSPNPPTITPLQPYFRSLTVTPVQQVCSGDTNVQNWSNPARIDMVQVRRDDEGNVITPTKPSYTIVTYYARRQDMTQDYDPIDNPVVMFRAEYPAYGIYQPPPTTTATSPEVRAFPATETTAPANSLNADITFNRNRAALNCTGNAAVLNRNALWLSHDAYGEADKLELLTRPTIAGSAYDNDENEVVEALYSHTLATPRGLALEASRAYRLFDPNPAIDYTTEAPLVPDTSFTPKDTNGDGKIDSVTISLGLASFDVGAQGNLKNNQPTGTRLRATRTIDLPNIQ